MSAQAQVITINMQGRVQTQQFLRDQVALIRALIASFRAHLAGMRDLLVHSAIDGFNRRGFIPIWPTHGNSWAMRLKWVADILAATGLQAKARARKTAEDAGAELSPKFADTIGDILRRGDDPVPEKAIAWLKSLPTVTRLEWEAAIAKAQHAAFFITGIEQQETLRVIKSAIEDSLREGLTLKQFEDRIRSQIDDLALTGGRLRNVWHNNVTNSYNKARYDELADPEIQAVLPYYLFDAIIDGVVRHNHALLEGGIAPVSWPGWDEYRPMLGFNCRCSLIAITAGRAKRMLESGQGWDMTQGVPAGAGPDEGYVRMV